MARPTRNKRTAKKPAKYEFEMLPVSVVTPLATTSFMCLADINEVTGNYGGSLVFTEDDLDQEVTFKEWKTGEKWKETFFDGVDAMIEDALDEYNSNNKKPAEKADKFLVYHDKDENPTDDWEFKIKNKDQPKIVDSKKQRIHDFDELVGNGSKIKVQVNLVPYFMQGKVGVTAYVDYVLIKEIVEYGGGAGGNPFDDGDFDDDAQEFDEDEYEEEEEEAPAKPARRSRKKAEPEPEEEEAEEEEEAPAKPARKTRARKAPAKEEAPAEEEAEDEPEAKPTRKKRRTKAEIEADKKAEEAVEEEEAPAKPARKRRVRKSAPKEETPVQGEDDDF